MSFHKDLKGRDLHAPSQEFLENNTGSTITKLKVVSLDGMGAVYPQMKLCNPVAFPAFGIANDDVLTGKAGYVTCLGFMYNLDTSAWVPGTQLFSTTTGDLSTSAPPASNNTAVAFVVRQHAVFGI